MSARTDVEAEQNQASSGVTPESLSVTLKEKLEATHVDISDLSGGCGQMFEAIIVSPVFAKKTTLARHRLVNGALKAEIAAIHAWTPKCFTPEEWDKKKATDQATPCKTFAAGLIGQRSENEPMWLTRNVNTAVVEGRLAAELQS